MLLPTTNTVEHSNTYKLVRRNTAQAALSSMATTDALGLECRVIVTSIPAKARFGRPYGKNGRVGGHTGETGSRNTSATQKINSLTLVSYLLLQTVFH